MTQRFSRLQFERLEGPPVVILGGHANALAVARSLSRRGVRVSALSHPAWPIRYSRHATWIPLMEADCWGQAARFLTGPESDHLRGSVLLPATDEGVSILIDHRPVLEKKFRLDRCNPVAQRRMLDKITTYEAAREAGVPTPRFWVVRDSLEEVADELVYPLIVKPRFMHLAYAVLQGKKHIVAHSLPEVREAIEMMAAGGVETLLVEKIPGPDDLLCSYYSYLDENGKALFDFTKRVIRRYPKNMGPATYHITDHVPGIREPSLRLYRHVGLQGLAQLEYKLDPRDGQHKLIECNARFTQPASLIAASGLDLAEFVYRQVVGLPAREWHGFRDGVRLWEPGRDLAAFRELRSLGELTFWQWLRSILHRQTFPLWSWEDPGPTIAYLTAPARRFARGVARRLLGRQPETPWRQAPRVAGPEPETGGRPEAVVVVPRATTTDAPGVGQAVTPPGEDAGRQKEGDASRAVPKEGVEESR